MGDGGVVSSLREQGKAILVMMGVAILSVLAMIVLDYFSTAVDAMANLGNITTVGSPNYTIQATLTLFIAAFAIFGTFATVTTLIIVVKAVVGVVKGLKN